MVCVLYQLPYNIGWKLVKLSSSVSSMFQSLNFCLNAHIATSLIRKKLGHIFNNNFT